MKGKHYTKEVDLYHYEELYIVDTITGEQKKVVGNKKNNENMIIHNPSEPFNKRYYRAWDLLKTQTTDKEYVVANKLSDKVQAFTNSLQPLCESSSLREIAEELGENKDTIGKVIKKLKDLGVIGTFEIANKDRIYTKYWVFNPYLTFNGRIIDKGISELFAQTFYAKV